MAYELRLPRTPRRPLGTDDAVAAARRALEDNPDAEPDIINLATGKPAAPGSSKNWREELKNRVGF